MDVGLPSDSRLCGVANVTFGGGPSQVSPKLKIGNRDEVRQSDWLVPRTEIPLSVRTTAIPRFGGHARKMPVYSRYLRSCDLGEIIRSCRGIYKLVSIKRA